MKISVVLIVKNEEVLLSRCLESLKGLDEIIICDTGSTDKTLEVAKKYTDKVYSDFVWCDDFAKARNHAKSKATGDWILSIDADEILHDVFKLREAVELAEKKEVLAVDCILTAEDNGQKMYYPRLFKNSPQVWWEGAIHNHLSVLGEKIGDTRITFGYSPAHFNDPHRALRILEKVVEEKPDAVREMFYLGREYWYKGNFEKAVQTLGKYVQRSQFLAEKAEAFFIMSKAYFSNGMGNDARDACLQAIHCNPHFKEAVLYMATLAGKGRGNATWEKNAIWWEKAAENSDNSGVLFIRT